MRTGIKRIAVTLLSFALIFTMFPAMIGELHSDAASYWTGFKASPAHTTVKLTWKKLSSAQQKKISGIAVFRGGKEIKKLSKKATSFTDKGLKEGAKFTYQIKTYKKTSYKQYYNSTTKKWVNKKPAKKHWKGKKTRTKYKYKYSNTSAKKTVTTKHTHKWGSGVITKAATESAEGVKTYTCTGCGQTKTESIAKLPHTHKWDSGRITKPATETSEGVKTFTCSCGQTKTEAIPKLAHTHKWDNGKVTKAATETSEGVMTYTCTGCGQTRTEAIAKLPSTADSAFDSSSLTPKSITVGGSFTYTLKTSKTGEENAITWTVGDTSIATVERSLWNGTEATVTGKKAGTTTITAKNWNGKTKTAIVTVTAPSSGGSSTGGNTDSGSTGGDAGNNTGGSTGGNTDSGSTGGNTDGGNGSQTQAVSTSFGAITPNTDGSFTLVSDYLNDSNTNKTPVKVNGVECGIFVLDELPSGSTVKVSAADAFWHNRYYQGEKLIDPYTYGYMLAGVSSSSNSGAAVIDEGNLYLVNAGDSTITLNSGQAITLVIAGTNKYLKPYADLVASWPERVSGLSNKDKAQSAIRYICDNYAYNTGNKFKLTYEKVGDCIGGNNLFRDLCSSVGISAEVVPAKKNHGGAGGNAHWVCKALIDGTYYMVDASPPSEGWAVTDSEIKNQLFYTWEHYEELYGK